MGIKWKENASLKAKYSHNQNLMIHFVLLSRERILHQESQKAERKATKNYPNTRIGLRN